MTTSNSTGAGLYRWATLTLIALALLLALGAVVSSFRVGMADPVWPTTPWHLLGVDWSEPSAGFLIEHSHRLAGWIVGGCVSILALWLWRTEPRPVVRWFGILATIAMLATFGQLHGVLISQAKSQTPGTPLILPGPTAMALSGSLFAMLIAGLATSWSPGRGLRWLGMALLVGVMMQGLVGGLRVHLHALWGEEIAAFHGSFAQIVLGLAVMVTIGTHRLNTPPTPPFPRGGQFDSPTWEGGVRGGGVLSPQCESVRGGQVRWAWTLAGVLYLQVVAGAVLRHTGSPFGPRMHILLAFVAVLVLAGTLRSLSGKPRMLAHGLCGLMLFQLLLGVEAWIHRFSNGFVAGQLQSVTVMDAVLRTSHALVGYGLFAGSIALTQLLRPNSPPTATQTSAPRSHVLAEAVA